MITVKKRIAHDGTPMWRVNINGKYRWFTTSTKAWCWMMENFSTKEEYRAEWGER